MNIQTRYKKYQSSIAAYEAELSLAIIYESKIYAHIARVQGKIDALSQALANKERVVNANIKSSDLTYLLSNYEKTLSENKAKIDLTKRVIRESKANSDYLKRKIDEKILIKNEQALLLKAAKRRKRLLSATSLHNGFYGIYQDLIDGRLPIDIDYFKSKFEVITENGKSLLVHKGTRHPASWRGKTNHHVTLNDYSQGVHRFRIYKTHRIVYAIHTGVDCVESDIGFIDGNVDNYNFSNLVYKG